MKKILSILLVMAMLTGIVFAEEAEAPKYLQVVAKGSASLEWGFDFGTNQHGFKNVNKLKLVIPFFDNWTEHFGGSSDKEASVYADISFGLRNKAERKLSPGMFDYAATLHFYGAYISIAMPNFWVDYAQIWKPINADKWPWHKGYWEGDLFNPGFDGNGGKIGYKNDDIMGLDVGLKFASNGAWDAEGKTESSGGEVILKYIAPSTAALGYDDAKYELKDPNGKVIGKSDTLIQGTVYTLYAKSSSSFKPAVSSRYALGLDFSMEPVQKYFKMDMSFNAILGDWNKYNPEAVSDKMYMNFGTKLSSEPMDGLMIALGMDGAYAAEYFGFDLGFTTKYKWVDFGVYYKDESSKIKDDGHLDMHIGFKSKADGDTNFVKGLGLEAVFNVYDLMNGADTAKYNVFPMGMKIGASYTYNITDSMSIMPYANFWGETNANNGEKFGMAYEVGVEYMPIEKVTVSAAWNHGKLGADKHAAKAYGDNMIAAPVDGKNGTFVLGLKLAF